LAFEGEGRFRGISGSAYRDDVDAIEVVAIPFWHQPQVTAVGSEECAGCVCDDIVLPGNEYQGVPVPRLFDRGLQLKAAM
jgi:hypothetical protein